MRASLKAGIISGLVAGIVTGIIGPFLHKTIVSMGLFGSWWQPISLAAGVLEVFLPLNLIWGIILGVIYSKAYCMIPGKGISKGLFYGLILYFILAIRTSTFDLAYGRFLQAAGGYIAWIVLIIDGLIIGIIYEFLRSKYYPIKDLRIKEYNMRTGILPGAIAGFLGGTAASIVAVLGPAFGLWGFPEGPVKLTFDLWLGQAGAHILINMVWGTIFGMMFAKVYNLVPSKGILKGLYYSLIIYLITSFQVGTWCVVMSVYANVWPIAILMAGGLFGVGSANATIFGLVLGLLYRKPTEAIAVKKEKIGTFKLKNCKHCNASIIKGSKFCRECGKKQ